MKRLIILSITVFLATISIAQQNDYSWYKIMDEPSNFWQDVHDFESYYKNEYSESIPEEKLGNLKDFYRFVNYWKSRLGIEENEISFGPYTEAIQSFDWNSYCEGSDPAQWELLGPENYASQFLGLVDEVLVDPSNPNNYLIGSERGGIWKSQSSGNSWVNVTDYLRLPGLNASEMIRNKFSPSHIIASTGYKYRAAYYGLGIIQSYDNGNTWELMDNFPNETATCVNKIIQDPNDNTPEDGLTLYAITNGKIYVSYNTGFDWTEVVNPFYNYSNHNHYLDIEIADNGDIFITTIHKFGFQGNIYKYANDQWYDLNDNNQFGEFQRAVLTTPYDGKIFMLCDVNAGNNNPVRKIYKTIDYGANWEFVKNTPFPGFKHEIEYSPESNIVYIGDLHIRIFKDEDPIVQTSITSLHMDIRDFEFIGIDENGYENVLTATDGGVTLLKVNIQDLTDYSQENLNGNHLPIGDFIGLGVSNTESEFVVSGAVHCNSFRLEDGTWLRFSGGDGGDCEVDWFDPTTYYYQANQSMLRSGTSIPIYNDYYDWFIGMKYEMNPNNPSIVYFGRGRNDNNSNDLPKFMIYNKDNNNLNTKYIDIGMKKVGAIGVATDNTLYIAGYVSEDAGYPNRLMKSEDNGNNWTDLSFSDVYDNSGNYYGTLSNMMSWKTVEDIILNPIDPYEMWVSIGGVWSDWNGVIPEKFRVLHSTNGGQTFHDYSKGLPAFPVLALEHQTGSNNRLFAGSDAGVYYREPGMEQWECFSVGMPIAVVTDLDYDPCSEHLYASTTGRAIYKTPVNFINHGIGSITPNETVWNTPKRIFNNLVIPEGTTLTIKSDVYIYHNKKIYVRPGAILIIDGGRITSGCSSLWAGIDVMGDPAQHQYDEYSSPCVQGKLILKNGAVIENAEKAVFVGGPVVNGGILYAGGIVQVIGNRNLEEPAASFINNEYAIQFQEYQNFNPNNPSEIKPNRSYFNNVHFEVNGNNFMSSSWNGKHVELYGVKGISFKGCTFINNDVPHNGKGIYCTQGSYTQFESGFSVSDLCISEMSPCPEESWDRCRFENLEKGIEVVNTGIGTFTVEDAIFENNSYGIKMSNVNNASVLFSDFYIGPASFKDKEACDENSSGYGIFMDNCTGFAIEENYFTKYSGAPIGNYTGMRIAETQATDEIYLNRFDGLSYANYTEGRNWGEFEYEGLEFLCNENQDNYADFIIMQNIDLIGGVQSNQGNPVDPAGNEFSPSGANFHILNLGDHNINYYYCGDGLSCPNQIPIYGVNIFNYQASTINQCLSHYGSGGGGGHEEGRTVLDDDEKQEREQLYAQALSDYNNVIALYESLKDGGNTEILKTEVETAWPSDMWELRAELLGKSPHLSMEVLKEAADKTDVLPESVLFEILAANPDELKKEELLKYLEDKDNPLPQYMVDILRQVAAGTTYKTVLQNQMSDYNQIKTRAAHDMIRSIINDTIYDYVQLRNWLDNLGGIRADHQIINTYLAEEDYNSATSLADMLPDLYNLSGYDLEEHNYYLDVLNLKITLKQQGRAHTDLTTEELNQLTTIAENSERAGGAEARGILETNYGYDFCDCLNVEDQEGYKSSSLDPYSISEVYGISINVDPNPAKEWTAFNYTLPDNTTKGVIKIVDITGSVIEVIEVSGTEGQHVWDTRNIKSGVYLYSFIVNGIVNSDKVVIQK